MDLEEGLSGPHDHRKSIGWEWEFSQPREERTPSETKTAWHPEDDCREVQG